MTVADALDLPLTPPPGGQVLHASGRTTVIWGDCRDPEIIAAIPAGYGLLCTDPPYGVAYNSGRSDTFTQIPGDDGSVDWPAVLAQWVGPDGTRTRGLADKRHVYIFGYRPEQLTELLRLGGSAELIWDKVSFGIGDLTRPWAPQHEPITFGVHVKRKAGRAGGDGRLAARLRQGSILRYQRPNAGSAVRHSNEKPWQLLAELIESSTTVDDLVVDPCAGSGSTGVAAALRNRRAFLVEVDRGHAELAARRVKAAERLTAQMDAA